MLPFHNHHRSSSSVSSQPYHGQQPPVNASTGLLQAAQQLGSFGAPTGNLTNSTTGRTTAGTDRLYASSGTMSNVNAGGQSAPPSSYNSSHPNSSTSTPNMSNSQQQFETPRRARHPDELHMSSSATNIANQRGVLSPPRDYQQQQQHQGGPRINLDQGTPGSSQYQNPGQLPGALQPGRPGAMSSNTAPTVPNVAPSEYATSSRGPNPGLSHNYTRSSPAASAGFDTGYIPYTATTPGTDQGQFTSPTNQKYVPQNTQRTVSNAPLGLADIRPRADSSISDALPGANPYSYDGVNAVPTNSNYLAPWAIYAFDWCKWPAQGHDAGKVAVGSYLEDGHNFVCSSFKYFGTCAHWPCRFKFLTPKLPPHHPNHTSLEDQNMAWILLR